MPPDGDSPVYRRLIHAYDTYLRVLSSTVGIQLQPGASVGQWVPLALYHHVFQLARALQAPLQLGYSDEGLPISRAMISATMNLLFIVTSGNPDGWALRYMLQVTDVEERMLEREVRRQRFDDSILNTYRQATQKSAQDAIAAFKAEGGIYPDKLPTKNRGRPRPDTWTGLSDAELAERLQLSDWKETEYDYLSGITHAQAVAILPTRDALFSGSPLVLGPHFRSPLPAIATAVNALRFATLAAMRHFNLAHLDLLIQTANTMMSKSIDQYREDSGANAMIAEIFGNGEPSP